MKRTILYLFVIISLFQAGCASLMNAALGDKYEMTIDSIASSELDSRKRVFAFVVKKGDPELVRNEYFKYLRNALTESGFNVVDTIENAEIVVAMTYSLGSEDVIDSKTVYGWVGGQSHNYTVNSFGKYGAATSQGAGHSSGYLAPAGTRTYSYKLHTRYLRLVAYDAEAINKLKEDSPAPKEVWVTSVASAGTSNDMRTAIPILLAGASKYFSKTTRGMVELDIRSKDERVLKVLGIEIKKKVEERLPSSVP